MSPIPMPVSRPEATSPRARLRAADARTQIERVRPDLTPCAPEYQGAVLLLLAGGIGPNVDRLVMRTGFARDFVARCLRRLTDNAWWSAEECQPGWHEDPVSCRQFWLDVDVALGRRLRRINQDGEPEWAPLGEWVKDFEYRSGRDCCESINNEYREIPPYNPEPVFSREEETEEDAAEEPAHQVRELTPLRLMPNRSAPPSSPPAAQWLGGFQASQSEAPIEPVSDMLVAAWAAANWLT